VVSAFSAARQPGNCQNCHSKPAAPQPLLPFDEWALDAHGTSAVTDVPLHVYGTDLSAEHTSPLTAYTFHKDYGKVRFRGLEPAILRSGVQARFPDSAGNCLLHLPLPQYAGRTTPTRTPFTAWARKGSHATSATRSGR